MVNMTPALREYLNRRIAQEPIEARIIRKVVKALTDAGTPVVTVWDGEERESVSTVQDVLDLAFNLDTVWLETDNGNVMLVMGNEWDIISDYHVTLEAALAPVNAYIEKNW